MPTSFAQSVLGTTVPSRAFGAFTMPRRQRYYPSPADWRDEFLYFLLVDRFSDGQESTRRLIDRLNPWSARPAAAIGEPWRWDRWGESGAHRWQGGTIGGVRSKLDYLSDLGVTALWLSPVFRQRGHLDSFHGYGIQHFLDVDPRFGTREELVTLVEAAHAKGIRVILDIIFNHSGPNWVYPGGDYMPPYRRPGQAPYEFGAWLDASGKPMAAGKLPANLDEGVWPVEFQRPEAYTRAGMGNLGGDDDKLDSPDAEHKRTDFFTLRDFALSGPGVLNGLAQCYAYWIALTDCDGFRIDTLKHVSRDEARNFCGAIKEFAANIGKSRFLLVGEVAGGDAAQGFYLGALERNLDAVLDIGGMRPTLTGVAKGLNAPAAYFDGFVAEADPRMGSHRNLGERHVSILDDHDHVAGDKVRFSAEAASPHQVVAGVALQLFGLGIPCLYYGTEQSLGGPEPSERPFLPGWKDGGNHGDRYLREAMFGPRHPRASGLAGRPPSTAVDAALPGFGPLGTAGAHCFDPSYGTYRRIAALAALRGKFPVLRVGRQYQRPISLFGGEFFRPGPGELVAWSRILSDEEALCVINGHGVALRGGDVLVDAALNPPGSTMTVVANTLEAAAGTGTGTALSHPVGSTLRVLRRSDGSAYVEIRDLAPSEVLVLVNHA